MGDVAKTTGFTKQTWKDRFRTTGLRQRMQPGDAAATRKAVPALMELVFEAHPNLDDFCVRALLRDLQTAGAYATSTERFDFETWWVRVQAGTAADSARYAAEAAVRQAIAALSVIPDDSAEHDDRYAALLVHVAVAICPADPPQNVMRDALGRVTSVALGRTLRFG